MEYKVTPDSFPVELSQKIQLNKGQNVFCQGEIDRFLYFIEQGIAKAYYTTTDGKEYIKSFLAEGDVIGSLASLVENRENSFSVTCLEDMVVYKIDFPSFMQKAGKDLDTAVMLNSGLIKLAMKKEKREYEFLCQSASERYLGLINSMPEIISRVTQNDIARYLGITPVALSRIRTKLRK